VLQPYSKQADLKEDTVKQVSLHLLLFVDKRSASKNNTQRIQAYLESLQAEYAFELQAIEVDKQPQLVEYYKLVATPALVKIAPEPRQTLAGGNLVEQLKKWWPRWQLELHQLEVKSIQEEESSELATIDKFHSVNYSAELIRLSDEIFRLKKEKEELTEQLRFKDQVLAMLAHDLRSPLTAASIAVETLEIAGTKEDSDRITQLKEQLYKQARKQFRIMNRMITNILQASKSMSAEFSVEPRPLQLRDVCQDVLSQLASRIEEKSQKLIEDIPGDLPAVYGDEELIRQVIVNLVENAIKYTPEGGEISLSILHRTSQKIQVSVGDTGPGIPPEKQERIFEGHFRLKRDREKEGYGIGLALCRKVIRVHYGQIWVDSSPNKGSCFHFTLPVFR
jgi:two-component system, OmpR family, clock-associated histidine kinase SasA